MLANMSRTPEILADAAYIILGKPSATCTGNLFIDEAVFAQKELAIYQNIL
jgi:citronellol/citronellal dehydrogenase